MRVFVVNTNVNFTAVNLGIADGTSLGGSAILNLGGTVNLTGVALCGNTASRYGNDVDWTTLELVGGAIFNRGGTVNATGCSFGGNSAQTPTPNGEIPSTVCGGAIRNEAGQMNLQSCNFVYNQASGGVCMFQPPPVNADSAYGGAIHNSGTMTLDLCTLTGNSATGGERRVGVCPLFRRLGRQRFGWCDLQRGHTEPESDNSFRQYCDRWQRWDGRAW